MIKDSPSRVATNQFGVIDNYLHVPQDNVVSRSNASGTRNTPTAHLSFWEVSTCRYNDVGILNEVTRK